MNLYIGNTVQSDTDSMWLPYSLLTDKAVHLFIASNVWDTLTVEVSEDIPAGVLKYMILKCTEKKVILPEHALSAKEVGLICEMFPDKAGGIRRAHMAGRSVTELLD